MRSATAARRGSREGSKNIPTSECGETHGLEDLKWTWEVLFSRDAEHERAVALQEGVYLMNFV